MDERRSALDTLLGHALEAHPLEMLPPHILASRVQARFRFRSPPLLSMGGGASLPWGEGGGAPIQEAEAPAEAGDSKAEAAAEAAAIQEAEALAEAGTQEAIADTFTADVVAIHIPAVVRAQTLESDCQHPVR